MPIGLGDFAIPYDQSEGMMPGMEIPTPGGTMKKMQFEFTDPAEAAAQPQIPPGAGIPPAGAQGAIPPAGMQPSPPAGLPGEQGAPQQGAGLFEQMMGGGQQSMGMGPDSSMFSDEQLMQMVQEDPADLQGQEWDQAMMDPNTPPEVQQQLQMAMMDAARRRLSGGGV